jgi:cellulose synthase (UDP-forming)
MTVGFLMFESRWLTLPLMRFPVHRPSRRRWSVAVVTTFVPGAEPLAMLHETIEALVALHHQHDTWVLDEGDDEHVRALCAEHGAHYFTRRNRPKYQTGPGPFAARTKHGNYNAWLDAVGYGAYEVVVNVDPDHILEPHFLERTLGHLEDEEVAYVQAAQAYYNQAASFVARGAAEETYAYYSSIQMTSYALGYPIVTGCHTVHRTSALREVGGFAPHDADDLLSTILYRAAGWKGVYVPEILGRGITPVDWAGYLRQQRRWASSVLDVKLRAFPRLASRLPRRERTVSLFHGLYYLHGLGTAVSIAVLSAALLSGVAGHGPSSESLLRAAALLAVLEACELFRQRWFLDPRREWGFHWRAGFLRFAKWPFVLRALIDAVFPRDRGYLMTRKTPTTKPARIARTPHCVAGGIVLTAWMVALITGRHPAIILQVLAALYVTLSALVVLTDHFDSPPPYDPDLAATRTRDPQVNASR